MRKDFNPGVLPETAGTIRPVAEGLRRCARRQAGFGSLRLIVSIFILAVTAFALVQFDRLGRQGRATPKAAGEDVPSVYWVSTQKEAYAIFKGLGVKGAGVVHFNRYFNMAEYFPEEQNRSRPFPVQPYDIRPDYEAGIDSQNWLFIANRTGLVRRIWNVLPDRVFGQRRDELVEERYSKGSEGSLKGHFFDIPQNIVTLSALPLIRERVVVTLDAGFFLDSSEPEDVARILHERLPNIAVLILSKSLDESDITVEARERLHRFLKGWYPG